MRNGFTAFFGCVLAASLVAFISGCGDGRAERAPVSGKVTMNGQPLTFGTVQFWPVEGRPARGEINKDGTYTLTTFDPGDGAVLGEHTVTVEAVTTASQAPKAKSFEEEIEMSMNRDQVVVVGNTRSLIPPQYATPQSSSLKREVKRGENKIDIELNAQGN